LSAAQAILGDYVLAGQILTLTPVHEIIDEWSFYGRSITFFDYEDNFSAKVVTVPQDWSADKDLYQDWGDFVLDEIGYITETSMDDVINQVDIRWKWDDGEGIFQEILEYNEGTDGPVGDWLQASQTEYGFTRKATIDCRWINDESTAISFAVHYIHQKAFVKKEVSFFTSVNGIDLEIGDLVRLHHHDIKQAEHSTIYAGYTHNTGGITKAGYIDPQTSAVYKAGANVQHFEGRHQYRIFDIETDPYGVIKFQGQQADITRSPLPDPLNIY
jgi:hypothetical protein